MHHSYPPERKELLQDEIDSLLRTLLPYYADELRQYVDEEISKLSPDCRLKDFTSLIPGGKKTPVAVFISAARIRAKVRWGDFLLHTQQHLMNLQTL